MSSRLNRKAIRGSGPVTTSPPLLAEKPHGQEIAQVIILLRYGSANQDLPHVDDLVKQMPAGREHLGDEAFARKHGADPGDLAQVSAFVADHGLRILETDAAQRMVLVSGSLAKLCVAFGVDMAYFEHPEGIYRGHEGQIQVPEALAEIVQGVLGLHNRPVGRPRSSFLGANASDAARSGESPVFSPQQLAEIYQFPQHLTGRGQRIALIELTGGYRKKDLEDYFTSFGLKVPFIRDISVSGGQNKPIGDPNSMDSEVVMDIEVAGALAPEAELWVYFAEKSEKGFLQAIKKAIADKVSIISISWGLPELFVSAMTKAAFNAAFKDAAARGITVCVASGDHGSRGNVNRQDDPDDLAHVAFPASSPYVLACGGTELILDKKKITDEIAWNQPEVNLSTGGGISAFYDPPDYQRDVNLPKSVNPQANSGRGVPDVAACAIGYPVRVDGKTRMLGGTSAVAPLWAALIARINQELGKNMGFINPILYALADTGLFRDIISGNNGAYKTRRDWDACTGLGSPRGESLLRTLSKKGEIAQIRSQLRTNASS